MAVHFPWVFVGDLTSSRGSGANNGANQMASTMCGGHFYFKEVQYANRQDNQSA